MSTIRRIGFTKQYYTLWTITSVNNGEYISSIHTYVQNLSKDLVKAQAKAKALGCTDLEPDRDLYGKKSWFETKTKISSRMPSNKSPYFEFGKYGGALIHESTDISYVKWYYNETKNIYCKKLLLDNGYVNYNDQLISDEAYSKIIQTINTEAAVINNKTFDVYAHKNLSVNDGHAYGNFEVDGANLTFIFPDRKIMYYQDFEYALPTINGKGKRIKGKNLRLHISHVNRKDNNPINSVEFIVDSFEILK